MPTDVRKAYGFRAHAIRAFSEAAPRSWRRSLEVKLEAPYGKAKPFRTSGGGAAKAITVGSTSQQEVFITPPRET